MTDTAAFVPTHMAPKAGMRTWATADGSQPTAAIPSGLEVELVEQQGDWAHVLCSNGWSCWVDGRELIDLRPLQSAALDVVDRLDAALKQYSSVIDQAAAKTIDVAEFRRRAFEAGMVVRDGDAWFLDLANGRWCRYDGFTVTTLDIGTV